MGQNTKTTCEVLQEKKQQQSRLQSKTLASEMSLTAAASTMFLMTNFLMALSFGTQRAQLVQRMGCTWPRPFLARPLFLLFLVCKNKCQNLREIQIAARKLGLRTKRHTFSLVHCVECTARFIKHCHVLKTIKNTNDLYSLLFNKNKKKVQYCLDILIMDPVLVYYKRQFQAQLKTIFRRCGHFK
uniref:Transmembrane protein n=1 Tax=Gasterosteus aculeatus aculeatus TaxID=481459 RepID=A0AAQ4QZ90_GASAC